MATRLSSALFADCSIAATFQAWAQFIEDTLVATGGWVVTSDTGQTLPSALPAATSSNQKRGFRIYRMADALQATFPVFVRIDYGSGNGGSQVPGMWLTIGTGSNGSGTITGIAFNGGATAISTVNTGSGSTSQASNCYGSAAPNRCSFLMFTNATVGISFLFGIERTKDATGADTGDGLLLAYNDASAGFGTSRYVIMGGGAQPTAEQGLSYALTYKNPTETFGGDIGAGMIIHFKGVAQQPGTNFIIVPVADVASEGNFNLTVYGATRVYQGANARPQVLKAMAGTLTNDNNTRPCMRYD